MSIQLESFTQNKLSNPLVLRLKRLFPNSVEEVEIQELIKQGKISEFIKKYGNYVLTPQLLSLAIYCRMDKIVEIAINNGTSADFKHLKDAAITGQINLFNILIIGGADIHHNNDEILYFVSYYFVKPYFEKTQIELSFLLNKYNLTKTSKNYGFESETAESNGGC